MSRAAWITRLWALAAACLWTGVANACAVCVTANERSRLAFFFTTIFLTLLPLGLIIGGLYWLSRNAHDVFAGEFADRDEVTGTPTDEPPTETPHA
ncbi:MAG: hypothetical protein ABIU54_09035 [Candidatus Eisenbacteria bacterium]